jgi:2'-5' RNA ligase
MCKASVMALMRLFVGVRVSPDEQPDLKEVCRKLKIGSDKSEIFVKWSPQENWHVTLKFLGEVDDAMLPELKSALDEAAKTSFASEVRASGIGGFPEQRHARVIFAGVARTQALLDLQGEVENAFNKLGFTTEDRSYQPHITLGRLRSAGSVTNLISPFVRKSFDDLKLSEIVLFESKRTGPFSVFIPIHQSRLNVNS